MISDFPIYAIQVGVLAVAGVVILLASYFNFKLQHERQIRELDYEFTLRYRALGKPDADTGDV